MEPSRLIYSPIVTRPRLVWPDGARIALWMVPNIEVYEYLPHDVRQRDPWPRMPHPDVQGYSTRDYGNRIGFWRMLDVLDRYQVPCTISLNIAAYEYFPEIMRACEDRHFDVMCHGLYNTQYLWGFKEDEERTFIHDCVNRFHRLTGRRFTGWFSPAGTHTLNTPDLVAEAGVKYYCDWFHDDQPFPMRVRSGSLISLPYQIQLNDGRNFRVNTEAEEFADEAIELFDRLYQEGAETGTIMSLAPHPYILGQPHRIREFERIVAHICKHQGVWKATGAQIAEWCLANYIPALKDHLSQEERNPGFYEGRAS